MISTDTAFYFKIEEHEKKNSFYEISILLFCKLKVEVKETQFAFLFTRSDIKKDYFSFSF